MPRQRLVVFHRVKGRNRSGNSHLTTGAQVSAAGERASVVALSGCCRPNATQGPFYVFTASRPL